MEALDLRLHAYSEFPGKVVTVNGRDYEIGPHIATGSKYVVHALINQQSGLSLHVLKARKLLRVDPHAARAESLVTAQAMAQLRTGLLERDRSGTPAIPFVIVVDGNGGTFEIHESVGRPFAAVSSVGGELKIADARLRAGDLAGARAAYEAVLAKEPRHTVALNNLAVCLARTGDAHGAFNALNRAVEIEPNYPGYRGNSAYMAAGAGFSYLAARHFIELQKHFPDLHDHDEPGIEIFLRHGRPDLALPLVEHAPVDDARRKELHTKVHEAVAARSEAVRLMQEAERYAIGKTNAAECLDALSRAHERYPNDLKIAFNYAFALRRAGEFARAAELLLSQSANGHAVETLYCISNAAFCCVQLADWPRAMRLLGATCHLVPRRGEVPSPFDLPGLAVWYSEAGTQEETPLNASRLIDRAISECPDRALVTPEIKSLAQWYRDAVKAYASGAAAAESS